MYPVGTRVQLTGDFDELISYLVVDAFQIERGVVCFMPEHGNDADADYGVDFGLEMKSGHSCNRNCPNEQGQ